MKKQQLFNDQKKKDNNTGLDNFSEENSEIETRAKRLGLPALLESILVDINVLRIIPEEVSLNYKIIAFEKNDQLLKVGIVDVQNNEALNIIQFIAEKNKLNIELSLISQDVFQDFFEQYSGGADTVIAEAVNSLMHNNIGKGDSFQEEARDQKIITSQSAPVTKLLSVILRHAIDGRASDIHIELVGKEYRVRFRVDGMLYSSLTIPIGVGRAVISRIKILSELKIDEKRKPQDGRFVFSEAGHDLDLRVSTLPVIDGEKVVLRLLDKDSKIISLENMGLMGKGAEILLKNIKEPYGIILMTGPTGSGKSTTLYACLDILNKEERNIITLEDPVEYSINGVNQSQINTEIGYTFANGLRSILRQDPNVIMVGEIRDSETAELTVHAALTGHLVLSTLHTNSSIGAIPRLIDMGIEPFLITSSLRVVAAQRLIRRICKNCKVEVDAPDLIMKKIKEEIADVHPDEMEKYGVNLSDGMHIYEGSGCEDCKNTGYNGRIAIFEALEIDKHIKRVILEKNGAEDDIIDSAKQKKMVMIKQDGLLKVLAGLTTLAEVERVTEGSQGIGGYEKG